MTVAQGLYAEIAARTNFGAALEWLPQILDVNVSSQPRIIRQVPTWIIRIVVDYNLVGGPIPTRDERKLPWRHAEVKPIKPEARRASASQMPHVTRSKTARKMSMFERMIEVQAGVGVFVPNPSPVVVHMRCLRVAWHIGDMRGRGSVRCRGRNGVRRGPGRRSLLRDIAAANMTTTTLMPMLLLRIANAYKRKQKRNRQTGNHSHSKHLDEKLANFLPL
jgi:hypothetical protein